MSMKKLEIIKTLDDLRRCNAEECSECALRTDVGGDCTRELMKRAECAIEILLKAFPPEIGGKVRFVNQMAHENCPDYCPPAGTIGTVKRVLPSGDLNVQWPAGTTRGSSCWSCAKENVVEVFDDAEA